MSESVAGMGKGALLGGLIGGLIGVGAMALASSQGWVGGSGGSGVRDYILANPEIIREAAQKLQDRELARVIDSNRKAIETPYAGAWAGAKDADVVLVEFFDYACPYCHHSVADVERLLAEDKKLKVVWRDWPVLGEDSVAAAQVSLAAATEGKFHDFYRALYANGRPTPDAVATAKKAVGVSQPVPANARAELENNYALARAIGASGTPVFVVGDKLLQGAVGYDTLKAAIAGARRRA